MFEESLVVYIVGMHVRFGAFTPAKSAGDDWWVKLMLDNGDGRMGICGDVPKFGPRRQDTVGSCPTVRHFQFLLTQDIDRKSDHPKY
jgi:hypothetical protein